MPEYILGIDASLSSTGWAVLDKDSEKIINWGKIVTKKKDFDTEDIRITYIAKELFTIACSNEITEATMESQFVGGLNSKTALSLSRLRGAMMYSLSAIGITIDYMTPSEIRLIFTGKGNSPKEETAKVVTKMYPKESQLIGAYSDKANKAKTSDIYDAISIACAKILKTRQKTCIA